MQATDDIIFGTLNTEQRQAVTHVSGPVLILAGAGSGKTRALTHRIAYLISKGVAPWQILSVTFTNKAAKEMKERIKSMLHITEGDDLSPWDAYQGKLPTMGTFHSICVRILRRDIERLGRDRNFVIYDSDDQEKLMKNILKEMRIEESVLKARAALAYIGRFKSEAVNPKEAEAQATSDRMQQIVQVYARYQKALRESNALDFDDLILETVRLFHECPDVLDRYQETWRYLHVDEYQDTNHGQYLFITLLAQKYRNLCVIGDPDQSIYGFRGADIRNILEFEKDYPDSIRIKLEQNYRSTQPILSAADTVISANPNRPEKKMWTSRTEGPKIIVNEVRDERREAEEVVKSVQNALAENIPLREQVILYRTHAQSRVFEEACMRAGIPYRILGGVKFYSRKEVKDILAYLYTILNPYDTVSLLRIINIPSRKIGETTLGKIQAFASQNSLTLWDSLKNISMIDSLDGGVKERIGNFTALIDLYRGMTRTSVVSELAERLLEDIKMEHWLKEGTEEGEERWLNVQELLTVMHKYDALDPETSLTSFLEEVALVSEVDKLSEGRSDALTLMTLHLCKGLEFEHVMIVGCEEGLFPHSNSMFDKEQMEEERRLMYVGMTRAKTYLRLFFAKSRFMWGEGKSNPPSRFLDDLPDALVERRSDDILSAFAWAGGQAEQRMRGGRLEPFRQTESQDVDIEFNQDVDFAEHEPDVGSRVEHPVFGQGTIMTKRGDVVEIRFDNGQKKTFALSIAPIKII
ncbi:MAG TPA: UvrD-helicase domain-containing protein [Candidatus Peribacteraceae bacterium]|nr:UvrD-helicase domain-containing protein [Candidatus Peribacteraceae bacterium]